MKKSNKIVAVLLALVMIITAVPMMTASAAVCDHRYVVVDQYGYEDCTFPDKVIVYECYKCNDKVVSVTGESTHKDLGKIKKDNDDSVYHYQICGDCGEYVWTEHNFVDVKVNEAPTCTASGFKKVKCADCGFVLENVEIPPVGHDFETIIQNNNAHTGKCKVCKETVTEAHIWGEGVVTKNPQCAANGVMTYTCTECGAKKTADDSNEVEVYADFVKIQKRHTYADKAVKVDENTHKYVCTVPGCGRVATEDEMNSLGKSLEHNFVVEVLGTSSCYSDGESATVALHITCKDCDLDITTKKIEHDFDDFRVENAKQHVQICDNCSKEQLAEHNWKDVKVTKEATCKEAGEKKVMCKDCEYETTVAIPKLEEHKWDAGTVTTEATCGKAGVKTFKCSVCELTKTEEIAKTENHTYGEWKVIIPATPLTDGTKICECTVCGDKKTEAVKYEEPAKSELGDVSGDGSVSAVDARLVLQYVAGLRDFTAKEKEMADMNADGNITAVDARVILQIVAGLK